MSEQEEPLKQFRGIVYNLPFGRGVAFSDTDYLDDLLDDDCYYDVTLIVHRKVDRKDGALAVYGDEEL